MSTSPVVYDHSDISPSGWMLHLMAEKRKVARPAEDFSAIKLGDTTLAYACCPACQDRLMCSVYSWLEREGCDASGLYASGLYSTRFGQKMDHSEVKCSLGCRWRVS